MQLKKVLALCAAMSMVPGTLGQQYGEQYSGMGGGGGGGMVSRGSASGCPGSCRFTVCSPGDNTFSCHEMIYESSNGDCSPAEGGRIGTPTACGDDQTVKCTYNPKMCFGGTDSEVQVYDEKCECKAKDSDPPDNSKPVPCEACRIDDCHKTSAGFSCKGTGFVQNEDAGEGDPYCKKQDEDGSIDFKCPSPDKVQCTDMEISCFAGTDVATTLKGSFCDCGGPGKAEVLPEHDNGENPFAPAVDTDVDLQRPSTSSNAMVVASTVGGIAAAVVGVAAFRKVRAAKEKKTNDGKDSLQLNPLCKA